MSRRRAKGALAVAMVPLMQQGFTVDSSPGQARPAGVERAGGSVWADDEHGVIHAPGQHLSAGDLAHEVGHLFRFRQVSEADLDRAARIMHVPSEASRAGTDPREEWFADYYSAAATGHEPWRRTRVAGGGLRGGNDMTYATITPRRMRRFRALLDSIGERENLGFGPLRRAPGMTGANPIEMAGWG